jgi:hypothetical protein
MMGDPDPAMTAPPGRAGNRRGGFCYRVRPTRGQAGASSRRSPIRGYGCRDALEAPVPPALDRWAWRQRHGDRPERRPGQDRTFQARGPTGPGPRPGGRAPIGMAAWSGGGSGTGRRVRSSTRSWPTRNDTLPPRRPTVVRRNRFPRPVARPVLVRPLVFRHDARRPQVPTHRHRLVPRTTDLGRSRHARPDAQDERANLHRR